MTDRQNLQGKLILITGAAVRVGRELILDAASAGADVVIHYRSSAEEAEKTRQMALAYGVRAHLLQADLADPQQTLDMFAQAAGFGPLYALVNNASVFDPLSMAETSLEDWNRHMAVNLTAPFLLSRAFAEALPEGAHGRIVNILDWRALRPQADHFPYTISKAGLAALTRSSAVALAPDITVNAVAFGAILPPSDGGETGKILENVPAGRWADLSEVTETVRFLLTGPSYITGEVIHLDGGRHLT